MPLGRLLSMTSKAMRRRADDLLGPHGHSLNTYIVLQAGSNAPDEGLSQRKLAEGMGIGGPALVRHVDRLEKEGLLQRHRDEVDRRITRIIITPEGQRVRKRLQKVMDGQDDEIRSLIDPDDVAAFERVLTQLHLYATGEPPPGRRHT
jgi:MarR family transcriptional regulator for hemolysin